MQLMVVQSFTFHQKPPHITWFQRISSHSERTELSPSWTREHRLIWECCEAWMEWFGLGWSASVCLAQELLYVALDAARQEHPAVALEGDAVGPDEELLKVPGHVVPADGTPDDQLGVRDQSAWVIAGERQLFPEELEEGVRILPVHIHLLKKLKLGLESIPRTDMFQRQEDFLIPTVLLQRLRKMTPWNTMSLHENGTFRRNGFTNAINAKHFGLTFLQCVVAF